MLVSLSRGKELTAKDDRINELEIEISENKRQLGVIDRDWKDAKLRLTKDATVKRLNRENELFKSTILTAKVGFKTGLTRI